MGVSGSGKTTVGLELAQRLGWGFVDADDFHPLANVAKMAQGTSLTDQDRESWLHTLCALIDTQLSEGNSTILACSALKVRYREKLERNSVQFVYLKGSIREIHERLAARTGHYMTAQLLESQFITLEQPTDVLVLRIDRSGVTIAEHMIKYFNLTTIERT